MIHILIFSLYHPQEKENEHSRESRNFFVDANHENYLPKLSYVMKYDNPMLMVNPQEGQGFELYRFRRSEEKPELAYVSPRDCFPDSSLSQIASLKSNIPVRYDSFKGIKSDFYSYSPFPIFKDDVRDYQNKMPFPALYTLSGHRIDIDISSYISDISPEYFSSGKTEQSIYTDEMKISDLWSSVYSINENRKNQDIFPSVSLIHSCGKPDLDSRGLRILEKILLSIQKKELFADKIRVIWFPLKSNPVYSDKQMKGK